jgi:hypothetical protein
MSVLRDEMECGRELTWRRACSSVQRDVERFVSGGIRGQALEVLWGGMDRVLWLRVEDSVARRLDQGFPLNDGGAT